MLQGKHHVDIQRDRGSLYVCDQATICVLGLISTGKLGVKKIIIASSETTYEVCFGQGDLDYTSFPLDEEAVSELDEKVGWPSANPRLTGCQSDGHIRYIQACG